MCSGSSAKSAGPAAASGAASELPPGEPARTVRKGTLVTAATATGAAARQLSAEALAVMGKFPPRPVPGTWKTTAAGRFTVMRQMLAPPFLAGNVDARHPRKLTMLKIVEWLELHPNNLPEAFRPSHDSISSTASQCPRTRASSSAEVPLYLRFRSAPLEIRRAVTSTCKLLRRDPASGLLDASATRAATLS